MDKKSYCILLDLTKTKLKEEYINYFGGYLGVLERMNWTCSEVGYREIFGQVVEIIKEHREVASILNEYFDSDTVLANYLIDDLLAKVS